MRFVYGPQDMTDLTAAQRNCWLITNGLGGYMSTTAAFGVNRNDHGILVAAESAPNKRNMLVHRLKEELVFTESELAGSGFTESELAGSFSTESKFTESDCAGNDTGSAQRIFLSSQEFADGSGTFSAGSGILSAVSAESDGTPVSETSPSACPEEGFRYLTSFVVEDGLPVWDYYCRGVSIQRRCIMVHGENTAILRYEIKNQSGRSLTLAVTPYVTCLPKGQVTQEEFPMVFNKRINSGLLTDSHLRDKFGVQDASTTQDDSTTQDAGAFASVTANYLSIYIRTNGLITEEMPTYQKLFYAFDERDGRTPSGLCASCCRIEIGTGDNETKILEISFSDRAYPDRLVSDSDNYASADTLVASSRMPGRLFAQALAAFRHRQHRLLQDADLKDPVARQLVLSAADFISRKDSTGGKTLLAGYPFFGDWGRDTMISLPGCTLSTGQYADARSILSTFLAYEKDGLVPNLFPDGNEKPMYNSVDAPLLLINGIWLYCQASGDTGFLKEAWPVMKRIIKAYRTGTHYGIYMDKDGLISAGKDLYQLTWMDVCVNGYLPTPRHGKPVEINAYWYNALRIMEHLTSVSVSPKDPNKPGDPQLSDGTQLMGGSKQSDSTILPVSSETEATEYCNLANQVRISFTEQFWLEKEGYLKDVISSDNAGHSQTPSADAQIRCNQIWAVTMPFTMLSPSQEARVMNTVQKHLFTPCGLRTLSPEDPAFRPYYGGSLWERDTAYHQGTVWPFPLGAFYMAYLKVYENSPEAISDVRRMLASMESLLREGCIGQISEIYDGLYPSDSRGCFAQAWSVGEILRVYKKLEELESEIS